MTEQIITKTDCKRASMDGEIKKMGFFKRIAGVILWPKDVMKCLVEKPRTFFSLFMVLLTTPLYYVARRDLCKEFCWMVVEKKLEGVSLDGSYWDNFNGYMMSELVSMLVTKPIITLMFWFIITFALYLIIKVFKGNATYKQTLSITGYSYVVILFFMIIQYLISFITKQLFFDASLANVIKLYYPTLQGTPIYELCRGIDIFSIWRYCVIGVGVFYMSKLNKAKVISITTAMYFFEVFLNFGGNQFM